MKYYMLVYDNGCPYEDNETYTIGIFNDYELAVKLCLSKGFEQYEDKPFFERGEKRLIWDKESIEINEIKLNVEIDWNGEEVK